MLMNVTRPRIVIVQKNKHALIPMVLANADAWKGLPFSLERDVLVCKLFSTIFNSYDSRRRNDISIE